MTLEDFLRIMIQKEMDKEAVKQILKKQKERKTYNVDCN
jgi:hypothetical protein